MKAQEKSAKDAIKLRFATALNNALKQTSIPSFRRLAKEAGMEPAHIQKISVGQLDVSLTTSIAIAHALGITYTQLANAYDEVTEEDVKSYLQILQAQKRNKGRAKLPLAKKRKAKPQKKK